MYTLSSPLSDSIFDIDIVTKCGDGEKLSDSTPFLRSACDPFLSGRRCFWKLVTIPRADKYCLMFRYQHGFQHPILKDARHRLVAEVLVFRDGAVVSTKRFPIPNVEQADMSEREVKLACGNADWDECDFIQVNVIHRRLFSEVLLSRFRMENRPVGAYHLELQELMQSAAFQSLVDERKKEGFERRISKGLVTRCWPAVTVDVRELDAMVVENCDESQLLDVTKELSTKMAEFLLD